MECEKIAEPCEKIIMPCEKRSGEPLPFVILLSFLVFYGTIDVYALHNIVCLLHS